ncbi:unnamed protein product [Effrenium voratum]|nr:unnamed protein product [Effrenium voratum]
MPPLVASGEGDACPATSASLLARKAEVRAGAVDTPFDITEGVANVSNSTNASLAQDEIKSNLAHDLQEAASIPDLENSTNSSKHGFGTLGSNLEFLMLKVAQLETIVELQQVEIHNLNEWKNKHMQNEHNVSSNTSAIEVQAKEEEKKRNAAETLKKVLHKHNHQREKREFVTPKPAQDVAKASQESALLQRQKKAKAKKTEKSLDSTVTSKIIDDVVDVAEDVGGTVVDGTGMVGDALGDAYSAAADQVEFVANTVIDSVEMAVDILIRGFTDWNAGCDDSRWPSMSVNSDGLRVDWGRQKCWVRLMGQTCNLFDFNFGTTSLDWPEPLKTVVGFGIAPIKAMISMGLELVNCATIGSPVEVIKCFGLKIIELVPPLNTLNKLSDMITEFIQIFAKVASTVVKQVLEDGQSLVQQAAVSKFPAAGAPPVIHHSGKNLMIKTHSQHLNSKRTAKSKPRDMSALQSDARARARSSGDEDPSGAINFAVHDQDGNYATKLITQFNGKEVDTSSCLAFAPKNKNGQNNQATKADWQVANDDDFIQLEPWAVPCDNSWMKDNWDKWQGYSFYTWEMSIEKCVTVTYSLSMQPVLAFVGGLEFDLMPAPLASLDTIVCWPDKQPGGLDLSVLRTEIRSGGVLLFSRTLRLTKRFGSGTDFVADNTFMAHETWRNPIGTATGIHSSEDDRTLEPMSRKSSLLEANQSKAKAPEVETRWEEDVEDLYLASADYGKELNITKTRELYGTEAAKEHRKTLSLLSKSDYFELFSFKNPGMVNFQIQGLLEDNNLDLAMSIGFGPFQSPEKRIRLINIVDQFSVVMTAIPFISTDTKLKALQALRDFTSGDVEKVVKQVPPPQLIPGSTIALYRKDAKKFLRMNGADMDSASWDDPKNPLPYDWSWERFTVVDAGSGQIALHSSVHNRYVRMSDANMDTSGHNAASQLPDGWTDERFTPVYAGNGEIGLHNSRFNKYIRMSPEGVVDSSGAQDASGLPQDWSWERFQVVQVKPYLPPGSVVAFHNAAKNRFLRMNDNADMDFSSECNWNEFPDGWTWERFTVVDGQNGQVALHNALHNRFIKMSAENMEASSEKAAADLPAPDVWTWERFAVVPAGGEYIALHNTLHNRFIRMTSSVVDSSGVTNAQDLPSDWIGERFRVVIISDFSTSAQDLAWSFESSG